MLGKEAAMACTEAVEEVISEHYNDQLREVIHELPEDSELREVCLFEVFLVKIWFVRNNTFLDIKKFSR